MMQEAQPIVKSEYPCFWFARYVCDKDHILIPFCNKCKQLSKLDENSTTPKCANMYHGHICGSDDLSEEAGLTLPLTDTGELFEFGPDGNETINFCFLPTKDMVNVGIINLMNKQQAYVIDLTTGEFIINGARMHAGFARVEHPIEGHLLISKKLNKYGINHDLLQFKIARADMSGRTIVDSFNLGYTCNIDNKQYEAILSINTKDFVPLISIKEK
jgi:hypothetical protein